MELLMEFMGRGFLTMLTISMPCVLTAAAIGLVVGILQAVTQVQEQTIAAAPKILSVFMVITIGGYGFVRLLSNFTIDGFAMAFNVIPKNDEFVLPADYYRYTRPFAGEMKDVVVEPSNLRDKMQRSSRFTQRGSKQTPERITPPATPESNASLLEKIKLGR
jgi:flagellar biosynthesis protein FliQ